MNGDCGLPIVQFHCSASSNQFSKIEKTGGGGGGAGGAGGPVQLYIRATILEKRGNYYDALMLCREILAMHPTFEPCTHKVSQSVSCGSSQLLQALSWRARPVDVHCVSRSVLSICPPICPPVHPSIIRHLSTHPHTHPPKPASSQCSPLTVSRIAFIL